MYFVSIEKIHAKLPPVFIVLGTSTYPLYLIHQNIGFMLFDQFGQLANKYIVLITTLFLMFTLSIIITKHIDPYIYKLIKKVAHRANLPTRNIP